MRLDLKQCAERPLDFDAVVDLTAGFASYPEIETIDPVSVHLRVAPVGGDQFLVRGRLETRLSAYCARCLEPFALPLQQEFQLTYLPESAGEENEPGETAMRTDEVDLAYYADSALEVVPLAQEQVNLALPMRLLCSESCPGLCPVCGANKKTVACDCSAKDGVDPRFETLRALIK